MIIKSNQKNNNSEIPLSYCSYSNWTFWK